MALKDEDQRGGGRRLVFLLNTTSESFVAPPTSSGTTSTARVTVSQGETASGFTSLLGKSALISTHPLTDRERRSAHQEA